MESLLLCITGLSSVFALSAAVFAKIRPRFPVKVNCWFCQKNLIISYDERNSWDCPHCGQYNGFCEDGSYNRTIPAQFDLSLNQRVKVNRKSWSVKNGLCDTCSLNQSLKIQQLASFVPLNEKMFDREIENYKSHLENVYSLCKNCSEYLKMKLSQEEHYLKPNILAWKLELSRRHYAVKKMIEKTCYSWFQAAKYIQFLHTWFLLTLVMIEYSVKDNLYWDIVCSNWILNLEFLGNSQLNGAAGLSITLLILCSSKQSPYWNVAYSLLWLLLSILPPSASPFSERMWIIVALSLLESSEIVVHLQKKIVRKKNEKPCKLDKEPIANHTVKNSPSEKVQSQENSNLFQELDLSKLEICSVPKRTSPLYPVTSPSRSQNFARPKPILSPSRFGQSSEILSNGNLTKASWVAGGYWQNSNWSPPSLHPTPNCSYPLSRSSSQSSGFGSIHTALPNRSPSQSRPSSPLIDTDRFSVFSDHLEHRFNDSHQRSEYSPTLKPASEVHSRSLMSTCSSTKETSITATNHWSWLPFMLGFSLAINVCVVAYLVVLRPITNIH